MQSFTSLSQKPLLVDLTVENGQRLKVIYGSPVGFHAIDVDSGSVYDLYRPTHVRFYPGRMHFFLTIEWFSLCNLDNRSQTVQGGDFSLPELTPAL